MIWTDLKDSLKARLYERVADPFLGSFTISFVIYNWRFFYTLIKVSDSSLTDVKCIIEQAYSYLNGYSVIVPFLIASFYVFVYPYAKQIVIEFYVKKSTDTANAVKKIKNKSLLTPEESKSFFEVIEQKENDLNYLISKRQNQIDLLKQFFTKEISRVLQDTATRLSLHDNDDSVIVGSFYYIKDSKFYKYGEFQGIQNNQLSYVVSRIGQDYLLVGAMTAMIPLPERMIKERLTILYFNQNGEMSGSPSSPIAAIRKLDEHRGQVTQA